MTRICCWCGAVLGEKCSGCGNLAVLFLPGRYRCTGCGAKFLAGEGGTTHGICAGCKAGVPPVLNALLPPDVLG